MKKNRIRIFDDDKNIFSTPDVFDEDGSRVGCARTFINIYGDMVTEIENRHLGIGYYSKSMDCVCADLNDDTLNYLLTKLQREHERRNQR